MGYLLKKKDKNGEALIYLALYLKDQTELISTGQRIKGTDWSATNKFPKDHLGDIAKRITTVKERVIKAHTRLQAREQVVTPFAVKQEYLMHEAAKVSEQLTRDKRAKENKKTIKRLVDHWIENNLFSYAVSTQKAVKESLTQFLTFLDVTGQIGIEREALNQELITRYERFLQDKKKLANSTHGKRMKHLRWFLQHIGFDVKNIKLRTHKKDIMSLSQAELEALENVDVSNSSERQKVKDLFLLGCYTGQRISELRRINETHIIDGKLCMTQKKTKRPVTIPIMPKTRAILERYAMRSPKINEPAVNREIKEICKAAGISSMLTVRRNVAGNDVEEPKAKYSQITSHTASKTFISLAPQWYGFTPAEVAAIVGKNLKTILNHYYSLPLESAIKKMEKSS